MTTTQLVERVARIGWNNHYVSVLTFKNGYHTRAWSLVFDAPTTVTAGVSNPKNASEACPTMFTKYCGILSNLQYEVSTVIPSECGPRMRHADIGKFSTRPHIAEAPVPKHDVCSAQERLTRALGGHFLPPYASCTSTWRPRVCVPLTHAMLEVPMTTALLFALVSPQWL